MILAGFSYEFNAIAEDGPTNELRAAFNSIFAPPSLFAIARSFLPVLGNIVSLHRFYLCVQRSKQCGQRTKASIENERSQTVMQRIGKQLIAEKKAAILAEMDASNDHGKNSVRERDLLTLLLRANLADDIPENQRLTDEEVLARESLQKFP